MVVSELVHTNMQVVVAFTAITRCFFTTKYFEKYLHSNVNPQCKGTTKERAIYTYQKRHTLCILQYLIKLERYRED